MVKVVVSACSEDTSPANFVFPHLLLLLTLTSVSSSTPNHHLPPPPAPLPPLNLRSLLQPIFISCPTPYFDLLALITALNHHNLPDLAFAVFQAARSFLPDLHSSTPPASSPFSSVSSPANAAPRSHLSSALSQTPGLHLREELERRRWRRRTMTTTTELEEENDDDDDRGGDDREGGERRRRRSWRRRTTTTTEEEEEDDDLVLRLSILIPLLPFFDLQIGDFFKNNCNLVP